MFLVIKKATHFLAWLLGNTILRIFFKVKVEGQGNLKGLKGPLLVVMNHCSYVDPFLIMSIIPQDSGIVPIHFAVLINYYRIFFPALIPAGAFPVRRGMGIEETLKPALKILENKGVVGIFPEGKRRHLGRPRRGRRGPAFLALKTNAPLLPIFLEGTLGLKSKNLFWQRRGVTIKIGKVFSLKPQKIEKIEDLNEPADFIRDKLFELKNA